MTRTASTAKPAPLVPRWVLKTMTRAHVTLSRSERSPIAALVTELLEDLPL